MEAAEAGETELVRLLLEHGADAGARDNSQRTAAEVAWGRGNREIYDLLQAAKKPQYK